MTKSFNVLSRCFCLSENFNVHLFRYTLVGIHTGDCRPRAPGIYTSFLSDNIWSWVQTYVASDGSTGQLGTAVGRVEFSSCKEENVLEYIYISDSQEVI